MDNELLSIKENDTWGPSILPSAGANVVDSKWVFGVKPDEDMLRKARLCAKGYSQKKDVDYTRTYAPVLAPALLRALLAISAFEDWEI